MLNLTQHNATPEQLAAGVVELPADLKEEVKGLLTFTTLEETMQLKERAYKIARIAKEVGATHAMIGGAPFFMPVLESMLELGDITAHYAFSQRVVVETTLPDGGIEKKAIFKHVGFVPPVE